MTSLAVVDSPSALQAALEPLRLAGKRVGVVPTMGALHEGHLKLMRVGRKACDHLVVTIFVNPTQFAPGEDLDLYPRPIERDLELCRQVGVDLVFTPTTEMMYPAGHQTHVDVRELTQLWEGAHRPVHFRGVTTVVLKLFNLIQPQIAWFGQKDYQQQLVIRQMCRDLNVPTEIVTVETSRDEDGLALSSRNTYLSPEERQRALKLSQSLHLACSEVMSGQTDLAAIRQKMGRHLKSDAGIELDYATIVQSDTLAELETPDERMVAIVAARVGKTRLIDNLLVPPFDLVQLNSRD